MINSATKQSSKHRMPHSGLLRGACHRARIPAARWLAMTASSSDRAACNFTKTSRALRIDLGVVALGVPFVDDVVDLLDVALGIELHLADHRVPGAALDRIHDLLRIGGAGF